MLSFPNFYCQDLLYFLHKMYLQLCCYCCLLIDVVFELRNVPQSNPADETIKVNMAVEFGKADIESSEYRYDIIIQEIESGFFLGPVLR